MKQSHSPFFSKRLLNRNAQMSYRGVGVGICIFCYVKPILSLHDSEDKRQNFSRWYLHSLVSALFLHQCNFFHFGKQTATLSRLPPQESNSPFLQVNQADAVNCPSNSVHAFFQAMPHPATSQTGLKRKGAIHPAPLLWGTLNPIRGGWLDCQSTLSFSFSWMPDKVVGN